MELDSFEPAGFRVMIRPENSFENRNSKSSIAIPDHILEKEMKGTVKGEVMKLGPICYQDSRLGEVPWCKPGDIVFFKSYERQVIKLDGATYFLVNDEDVLGVLK